MEHCELLIIGAGAAGMSAAAAAWKAGVRDLVLVDSASAPGGILRQCSHRGFGRAVFGTEITGPEYASFLLSGLKNTGVRLLPETEVLSVSGNRRALLSSRAGLTELSFHRLILAAGCRERSIGSLPVTGTRPSGVFTAGQAQELLNLRHRLPGREIIILGSGDLGMIMAAGLQEAGAHVIAVAEQEDHYGGLARNYHRFLEPSGIPLLLRTTVTELYGSGRLTGVLLRQLDTGAQTHIPCDTLVTAVGLIPERALVSGLGSPDWLSFAGNCHHVHELVDSAVAEAASVGRHAASALAASGHDPVIFPEVRGLYR